MLSVIVTNSNKYIDSLNTFVYMCMYEYDSYV